MEPMILKLLNTIILNRIRHKAENLLHPNQYGCRSRSGCKDAINHIITAATAARTLPEPHVLTSTDFSKAFDSVLHTELLKEVDRLEDKQISEILISQYKQMQTRLTIGSHAGQNIRITNGILQGDPLSPILFVIAISHIHKAIDAQCRNTTAVSCIDDILAVVPLKEADNYLQTVEDEARRIGLSLNKAKSKIIPLRNSQTAEISIKGVPVDTTTKFLGITIDGKLNWTLEIDRRIQKAE